MEGDPDSVPSHLSESFERNDDAVSRGKGTRALFPEAVPLVPQVGRSKQPVTNKKPGTDKKKAGTAPSRQRKGVERNGSDPPSVSRGGHIRQPKRWFDDASDSPAKQPGTAPSHQSENPERNDGAAPPVASPSHKE